MKVCLLWHYYLYLYEKQINTNVSLVKKKSFFRVEWSLINKSPGHYSNLNKKCIKSMNNRMTTPMCL